MSSSTEFEAFRRLLPAACNNIYLNSAAVGPAPTELYEQVTSLMHGLHQRGIAVYFEENIGALREESRRAAARMLNASPEEIYFGRCIADGVNTALFSIPVKEGGQFVLSTQENPAGILSTFSAASCRDQELADFAAEGSWEEILAAAEQSITDKTSAVVFSHVLHTYGNRMPAKELCAIARRHGAYTVIDGAQSLGNGPVDVKELGCDFYLTCPQKWLGGFEGITAVYVSKDIQSKLRNAYGGKGVQESFDFYTREVRYKNTAGRFEYGSSLGALSGVYAVTVDLLEKIGPEKVFARQRELHDYMVARLSSEIPQARIWSSDDPRMKTGIVAVTFPGQDHKKLKSSAWTEAHIACQLRPMDLHDEAGSEALRFSLNWYNLESEIDTAVAYFKGKLGA